MPADELEKHRPVRVVYLLQQRLDGSPIAVFTEHETYALPGADLRLVQYGVRAVRARGWAQSWKDFVETQASKTPGVDCQWTDYPHAPAPLPEVLDAALADTVTTRGRVMEIGPASGTSAVQAIDWSARATEQFRHGVRLLDLASGRTVEAEFGGVDLEGEVPSVGAWFDGERLLFRIDTGHVSGAGWLGEGAHGLHLLRPGPEPRTRRVAWREPRTGTDPIDQLTVAAARERGDEEPWAWGIPLVHQRLAAPLTHPFRLQPPTRLTEHGHALGYWGALHHLLLYRLGWERPDLGLRWWFEQGKPTDDPTLALIASTWDASGALDPYLAWLMRNNFLFLDQGNFEAAADYERPPLPQSWQEWMRHTERSLADRPVPGFGPTSGDSLHLHWHLQQDGTPDESARLLVIDASAHRALFLADSMQTWYWDLARVARHLPLRVSPGWRVEAFVRPVGYLGTFRRSSATLRWFTGRHQVHAPGGINPDRELTPTDLQAGTLSDLDRQMFLQSRTRTHSAEEWAQLEAEWPDDAILMAKGQGWS